MCIDRHAHLNFEATFAPVFAFDQSADGGMFVWLLQMVLLSR